MFTPINAKKINFSDDEVNVIKLGVDLAKRSLYNQYPEAYRKYASFSNIGGIDYNTHNKEFHDRAVQAAYERTGMSAEKTNLPLAFSMSNFMRAFFSVIEEVIDNVNSKNEIAEILTFAEVRSMAEGDSMNIDIKATNAYFFYKTGRGRTFGNINKYFGKNIALTPAPAETTISFNRTDIVAGRVDWGKEIARAIRGIRSGYLQDVAAILYSTTINPIGNKIIETGGYDEPTLRAKLQLIQAKNGSSNTVLYGTNIALANVLPADNNLKLGLGMEYMDKGYITTQFGYNAVELPQALKADNETIIIPNNYVVGMSIDVSKPVAIGISGETRVVTMQPEDNASEDYVYTVKSDWDVKMGGQGTVLLFKVA